MHAEGILDSPALIDSFSFAVRANRPSPTQMAEKGDWGRKTTR
jgi:hypothetical protein